MVLASGIPNFDWLQRKFELASLRNPLYTRRMAEPYQSVLQETSFVQFLPTPSHDPVAKRWESAPRKLPMKRSVAAGGFLLLYLAAYIGVGYAGVALVEEVWSAIFR